MIEGFIGSNMLAANGHVHERQRLAPRILESKHARARPPHF